MAGAPSAHSGFPRLLARGCCEGLPPLCLLALAPAVAHRPEGRHNPFWLWGPASPRALSLGLLTCKMGTVTPGPWREGPVKGVRERLVPVGTAVAVTLSHVPSRGDGGIAVDQRRPASPPSAGPGVAEWTEPWCPASWGQIGPWCFSPTAAFLRGRGHGRGWSRGHPGYWLAGVGATVSLELVGQPPGLSCRAHSLVLAQAPLVSCGSVDRAEDGGWEGPACSVVPVCQGADPCGLRPCLNGEERLR